LARNYGLDISMPDANFAVASAAQKEYQKQCTFLYRDFMKNMNSHIKQEQKIKLELRNLKKQKMLNSQYSLYRTDGKDLFSTAKAKRELLLKKNELSSSFFEDLCFNPWGLDSIIDEDLIPLTASPNQVNEGDFQTEPHNETEIQYDTENFPPKSEVEHHQQSSLAIKLDAKNVNTHVAKVEHLLQSQSQSHFEPSKSSDPLNLTQRSLPLKQPDVAKPEVETNEQNTDTEESTCDGEVDIQTERTRARSIVIDRNKFLELQRGDVNVKLRNKNGAFLVKPVKISYDPEGVDAVFAAKDPSKERMALVRQNTNWKSPTVSAELKINNRIAIQKSLIGKAARKTTVAEIFNSARDRKTRHFRIISNSQKNEENGDEANKDRKPPMRPTSSPVVKLPSSSEKTARNTSVLRSRKAEGGPPIVIHGAFTEKASKKPAPVVSRENSWNDTSAGPHTRDNPHSSMIKRNCESVNSVARPASQASMENHDVLNTSGGYHKVTFARRGSPDLSAQLNRSASSMSMREGNVQFMMSDSDMNNMLQRLIAGKGEKGDYSTEHTKENVPDIQGTIKAMTFIKRLSRMSSRNKRNTPSDIASSIGTNNTLHLPRRVSSRQDTHQLIKEAKQKDNEYNDTINSMRRRVALGASKSRTGFR
jgi:hypothetical protein